MTLRALLIGLIGAVMAATLLFGSVATYLHATNKVRTEMDAAIAVGGRIAHNAVDDVEEATNAQRRLELLVADFDGDRHLRAEVLDDKGVVRMASKTALPDDPVPEWFNDLLAGTPRSVEVELPQAFEGHGRLVLRTDSRNEVSEVWDDMLNTLMILFAFCAMIAGLVYLTIGRALKPLESLSSAFADIGTRGFAVHLPEAGPEELKRVYHGFNEMVDRLAAAETENRLLQEQIATLQEEERAEIARDLHDEIGPFLFSADVDATTVQRELEGDARTDLRERVTRIRESVVHMQRHVRDMLSRLRAGPRTELGLAVAVENLIAFWRIRQPEIVFEANVNPESFTEALDAAIFRVVQESLSNAVKHGNPKHVRVNVGEEPGLIIVSVEDDGTGLRIDRGRSGFGIKGMRERVTQIGGTIDIGPHENGSGVRVLAKVPFVGHPALEPDDSLDSEIINA